MNYANAYMNDGSYTKATTVASGQKIMPGNEHLGIITYLSLTTSLCEHDLKSYF